MLLQLSDPYAFALLAESQHFQLLTRLPVLASPSQRSTWYPACISYSGSTVFSMPSSDATWLALLDEQKQAVRSSFNRLPNTDNARSFRRELELLCKKEGEKRPPIVSRTIIDSIYPIAKFSKIIEDSAEDLQRLSPGERLEGLVWMTSFALIEVSWPVNLQLHSLRLDSLDVRGRSTPLCLW